MPGHENCSDFSTSPYIQNKGFGHALTRVVGLNPVQDIDVWMCYFLC